MGFFAKRIIAKQSEYSWIKCICIFHVLTVRGLSGNKGASAPCMGLPGNAEAPLATCLLYNEYHKSGNFRGENILR